MEVTTFSDPVDLSAARWPETHCYLRLMEKLTVVWRGKRISRKNEVYNYYQNIRTKTSDPTQRTNTLCPAQKDTM